VKPKLKFCTLCGKQYLPGTNHKCNPEDKKNHVLAASRDIILGFGTPSEKIFYRKFFKNRRAAKK
jgi:hypothetical protein